jgi:hypothetical protein
MDFNDLNINVDLTGDILGDLSDTTAKEDAEKTEAAKETAPKTKVYYKRGTQRHHTRRIISEIALENELPWHFEQGASYHCISGGDVDSLTYLRAIVKQQKIKYVLISSWCMAITDLEEIKSWIDRGYIGRVDFYVGEIFPGSYSEIYAYLKESCIVDGARCCVFRNHSKIMAGYGERFDFAIEGSANINTNPRTEQTVITIDTGLVDFYKSFF